MKNFFAGNREELDEYTEDGFEIMDLDEEYYEQEAEENEAGYSEFEEAGDEIEYFELDGPEADERHFEIEDLDETQEDETYFGTEETEDVEEYYETEEAIEEEEYFEIEDLDEAGEYYESEEVDDDDKYYESEEKDYEEYYETEEAIEEEEYFEIEDLDEEGEYYESEETDDDGAYYETEAVGEYYELEDLDDEEEYYELDELEDDDEFYEAAEEEHYDKKRTRRSRKYKKDTIFSKMIFFLSNMNTMDRMIAGTGVLVLVFAIVAGSMFASAQISAGQVEAFAELGTDLDEVIGESGLIAVADATMAKQEAAQLVEEPQEEMPEEETEEKEEGSIEVIMNLSSIQQDLKIKFINKKSTKLIASVPFEVEVTDADQKTYTLKDEDMDGIIYQSGLTAGKYTVSMIKLPDEEYQEYAIQTEAQQVTVKDKIEYKKVDVVDEIKTEAEVNASVEDTKVQETVVESVNTDTVAFVESTKTENGEGTYSEVNKATITDPATVSGLFHMDTFRRLSSIVDQPTGGITNPETTPSESQTTPSESQTMPSESQTTPPESQTTPPESQTTPSESQTTPPESQTTPSESQTTPPETQPSTPQQPQPVTLNKSSIVIDVQKTDALTASCPVTWTSENTAVATVDGNGVVTGVSAGTTRIIATSGEGVTAACSVTVSAVSTTISPASLSIKVGESATPAVTVTGTDKTVVWASSDASVATVAANGTVTGVKAGTATITATANGVSASCQVTVTAVNNAVNDTTTALKDNKGNQVYIKNAAGEYVAAVYADYYKYDKFYIKSATYKYTGWQTIDGSVYYYDANGNVVTGTQVIQGATYNFDVTTGALVTSSGVLGIDVSKWNGTIDWNAVKNAGVNYVIIRCGYRGSSTGALIEDPTFRANIKGATSAGLKVGVYFFTQAVNEVEAVEEASMVLSLISGYNISYPVFLDVESSGGRADSISADVRTSVCNAFCQTIANSGYATGIYANKTWLTGKINVGSLGSSYKVWLAQYAATASYGGKYQIWQYSSKGSVPGIKGNVDMNLSYLGY